MAYESDDESLDRLSQTPEWQELVAAQAAVTPEMLRLASTQPEEELTKAKLLDYLWWRAMGKTWRQAAMQCEMSESLARQIEASEDIVDRIVDVKAQILENPEKVLIDLLPEALGVLREKIRDGNMTAIRTITEMVAEIGKAKAREEVQAQKELDREERARKGPRAQAPVNVTPDGEPGRSASEAPEVNKQIVERVGRRLIDQYGSRRRRKLGGERRGESDTTD